MTKIQISQFATIVLGIIKRDEVFETVKGDRSLQILGMCMLERVGKSHVQNVRRKLRQLARHLILLRSQDKQPQDT